MPYDRNNVFAKILRGELPCTPVYEDEHVLAFRDIHPQAPTHVILIPKGEYLSVDDFSRNASDAELAGFMVGPRGPGVPGGWSRDRPRGPAFRLRTVYGRRAEVSRQHGGDTIRLTLSVI